MRKLIWWRTASEKERQKEKIPEFSRQVDHLLSCRQIDRPSLLVALGRGGSVKTQPRNFMLSRTAAIITTKANQKIKR
jgi:hypothetical protein